MTIRRDIAVVILLASLGIGLRLALVNVFPTIPVSDFRALVTFGLHLRDNGLLVPGSFWEYFSPGLPICLAVLFRIAPFAQPDVVARTATAIACGLMALAPFLVWRSILPFWVRFFSSAALALWPGQILFSGVVAQDNWVILPAVFLGALAVRSICTRGCPVLGAFVYVIAVSIRQEMLVVLVPLLLACVRVDAPGRWRRLSSAAATVSIALLLLAAQRFGATGRFALTTEHGGVAVLGSYVPGAAPVGWTDPTSFVASVQPELLRSRQALHSGAWALAFQEALRRPGFHVIRIFSSLLTFAAEGEVANLFWSIGAPETLPPALRSRGADLANRLRAPLSGELAIIQGLFVAAFLIGVCKRNPSVVVLSCTAMLQYIFHGLTVPAGRYFLVATALQLLAIVLAGWEVAQSWPQNRRLVKTALAAGAVGSVALLICAPRLQAAVEAWDGEGQQFTYRFVLKPQEGKVDLACVVERGRVSVADAPRMATLQLLQVSPSPGDIAAANCELNSSEALPKSLVLRVSDNYAPGGFPGRVLQRVYLDDKVLYVHDIGQEPGSGSTDVLLGTVVPGTKRRVRVQIEAIHPDIGWAWGNASLTELRIDIK